MSRRHRVTAVVAALIAVLSLWIAGTRLGDPLERLRVESAEMGNLRYSGSWLFPRGGPYVLGFESPEGNASLLINGELVAKGSGVVSERVVYPPGVVNVQFTAPVSARLLWHPPGRRGPLEYVMSSSLSPRPRSGAKFSSSAGADPVLALLMAICLVAIGVLGWSLIAGHLPRLPNHEFGAMAAVFVLALVIRLIDLDGAGQTWDEDVNWSAGRNYLLNLARLDFGASSWRWNYEHPPWMKFFVGIGALASDGYGAARAVSAILMSVSIALLIPFVSRLFNRGVAIVSCLFAALTPHLVAHGKIVGHESMSVFGWMIVATASLWVAGSRRDRDLMLRLIVLGVALGFAAFSRFANLVVVPFAAVLILVYCPRPRLWRTVGFALVIVPIIALLFGYLTWPRLWPAPVDGIVEAWERLRKPHGPEFFLGGYTNQPPWHYFIVYLFATAPLGLLIGAFAWIVDAIRSRRRRDFVLFIWIVTPLLVSLSPVRQDGVRYILPALLAMAVASASGYVALATRVESKVGCKSFRRWLVGGVASYLVIACYQIHPYYLDFYGETVGGASQVAEKRRFEIAWWGEGLDRGIEYLNRNAKIGDSVFKGCLAPSHLAWMRHDLWDGEARYPARADWIIRYQPHANRCTIPATATKVFSSSASGAALVEVYRNAWR